MKKPITIGVIAVIATILVTSAVDYSAIGAEPTNEINAEGTSQSNGEGEWYESIEYWQIAIPGIIGGFMAIITVIMWKSQERKNKNDALFKVFSLLSSPEIREARRKVHKHGKPKEPLPLTSASEIPSDIDLVLSSLDQVSIIVLKEIVDYEIFFEIYGQLIVRDYMRLENVIKDKRDKNTLTLKHFKELKEKFEERPDLGEVKLY